MFANANTAGTFAPTLNIALLHNGVSTCIVCTVERYRIRRYPKKVKRFNILPCVVMLSYPNGDAPFIKAVCAGMVIRALRYAGIDLQWHVHKDVRRKCSAHPKKVI